MCNTTQNCANSREIQQRESKIDALTKSLKERSFCTDAVVNCSKEESRRRELKTARRSANKNAKTHPPWSYSEKRGVLGIPSFAHIVKNFYRHVLNIAHFPPATHHELKPHICTSIPSQNES